MKHLHSHGESNVRVSVNVSPEQFSRDLATFVWVQYVKDFAATHPELATRFEIEVTESTVMQDAGAAHEILQELKAAGLRIALDDFGTGHSSLAQLNKLPIDVLKFDRSLIRYTDTDNKSRTLMIHLAKMAQELQLETVAEGVETEAQIDFCRDLEMDLIQGYAFYKPMAMESFYSTLTDQTDGSSH